MEKKAMMVDPYWYTALHVAAHFESDFAETTPPKKAHEMMVVAMAMAGMQAVHKKTYWIQGVRDSEGTPDVRTMFTDENESGSPWAYQQDVEVVTYTKYSKDQTLAEFIASTKLFTNSAYDELTTILTYVEADAALPSQQEWSRVLTATGKRNPVIVLGRIDRDRPLYRLAFVHPEVEGAVDYDAMELLKSHGDTKVVKMSRGIKFRPIIIDENEKHCPFENFGVQCKRL